MWPLSLSTPPLIIVWMVADAIVEVLPSPHRLLNLNICTSSCGDAPCSNPTWDFKLNAWPPPLIPCLNSTLTFKSRAGWPPSPITPWLLNVILHLKLCMWPPPLPLEFDFAFQTAREVPAPRSKPNYHCNLWKCSNAHFKLCGAPPPQPPAPPHRIQPFISNRASNPAPFKLRERSQPPAQIQIRISRGHLRQGALDAKIWLQN